MKQIISCLTGAALCLLCEWTAAQDWTGQQVNEVRLQGLDRVSEQVVRAQLETQAGKPYNPRAVARDIRRLYEMGHWDHIRVDGDLDAGALTLTYIFVEKRRIQEIRIIGNDKVRLRHVRGALTWKEGESFVPDAYDDERKAIIALYQSKGLPNASVDITVEEVAPGQVRVTYAIDEGKKARIRNVTFDGNDAFSDRQLRKGMKTRSAWWFLGGRYNEDKFEADLDKLIDKYANAGHLEAQVAETALDYSEDGKRLNVTIHLTEGAQYSVESLEVAGNQVYDKDEVLDTVKVQAGEVHDKGQVEKDASEVEKKYRDSGYVNATVTPQTTLDPQNKTTHVVHRVQEENLKYLQEINIAGNTVTKDEVVRRQLMMQPGDRFDGSAVKLSQQRLQNTEYFQKVRLTLEDIEGSDLYNNLMVNVEEGDTGNFNFGAGFSTEEKFGVFGELKLNNFDIANWPKFSGGGQQLSLRVNTGQVHDQYSLSFTDPEIAGAPLAFGFDVFNESYHYTGGIDYLEATQGAQLRLGKSLSPYLVLRTSLRYSEVDISNLPSLVTPQLWRERGGSTTISNTWTLSRNTLDSNRDPSSGARHDFSITLAGLGGDNNFTKLEHDSTWYFPLGEKEKWVLSYRSRQGWVNEYGSSEFVPISERFFAGGTTTVRGYDNRDIGPKENRFLFWGGRDSVGGKLRVVNNFETKYKLNERLRLYGFVDAGGVWATVDDFDASDIRYSAGLGIGVDVPMMGPIRIDYGIPINPDEDQGSGRLHLMTGFRF